jgi:DNA-binding CsgD family transcriptional regulator
MAVYIWFWFRGCVVMESHESAEICTHKRAATIAHVRLLCTLGLGGQIIMPALLRTLAEIVPYDAGAFCWTDGNGRITNLCEAFPDARQAQPSGLIPSNGVMVWSTKAPGCERHARCLRLPVGRSAQPAGMLSLARDGTRRPFSAREQDRLFTMVDYLHKGILARRNQRGPYVDSGEMGLMVLDESGTVRMACPSGRRLFLQAACPHLAPTTGATTNSAIEDLGVRLNQAFSDPTQHAVRHQNDWGLFEFRPRHLACNNGLPGGMGVCVSRYEPQPLRLMRGMKNLGLSSRQMEAVLLLGFGYSHRTMAQRMGVSYHTVVDHVRQIYRKLGVRDTHQLLARIMGMA